MSNEFSESIESNSSTLGWKSVTLIFFAIAVGTVLAATILPAWLPGLEGSLLGESPKAFWYLSRASAMVAFILLWASMVMGSLITNKISRLWPGGPAAFEMHEYLSLLGLAFALFHGLILLGDHYINYTLAQIVTPFASRDFKPLWVGLGQLGFYIWGLIVLSFYVRKQLGRKAWRLIHYASFLTFLLALVHGVVSGTDSGALWASGLYWTSGASLFFLVVYRILASLNPAVRPVPQPVRGKNAVGSG